MKTIASVVTMTCLVVWMIAASTLALGRKLPDPDTTGGIGGTGNAPTTMSEKLLQPSSADKRHPCPSNLEIANYRLVSAGKISVAALCIGQETKLLNGDQLQIQLRNASTVRVDALGRVRVGLMQTEAQQGQTQNFDIVFSVDSGRVVISVGETRIEGTTNVHPRLLVRDGMIQ